MRWFVILIIVLLVIATAWFWRRSRPASIDAPDRIIDQQASAAARQRLDEHRNRNDGIGSA